MLARLLLGLTILGGAQLPSALAQSYPEPSEPCGGEGEIFFLCRLTDGNHVAVCGLDGDAEDTLELDVRLYRGRETVWLWPEKLTKTSAGPMFFFERQAHMRSTSYHLWFERDGEAVDVVDHWTEGSRDSHFVGLVVHDAATEERRTLPCDGDPSVLRLKGLADRLPHRAVPVP